MINLLYLYICIYIILNKIYNNHHIISKFSWPVTCSYVWMIAAELALVCLPDVQKALECSTIQIFCLKY